MRWIRPGDGARGSSGVGEASSDVTSFGRRLVSALLTVVLTTAMLLVAGSNTQVHGAPAAGDFEPRQTIHTYPSVIGATHQAEVATGPDGTTVAAFVVGSSGYVSLRAAGSTAWGQAVKVTDRTVYEPELAIGADGTTVVGWALPGSGVQMSIRPGGSGTWEPPVEVEGTQHQVAVSPSGVATVVSSRYVYSSEGGHYRLQSWRRPAGAGTDFAGPATISPAIGQARTPDLVIDPAGRPVVTWSNEIGSGHHDQVRLAIGAATTNTWPTQEVVTQIAGNWTDVHTASVTAGPDGSLTVAYARDHSNGDHRVDARVRTSAGGWGANAELRPIATPRVSQVQAVTTGNGTTVVAWSDQGTMKARHRGPGATTWSGSAVTLGDSGTLPPQMEDGTLSLAGGPDADAVATWSNHANQSNGEVRVRQFQSGSWSTAYVLSEGVGNADWNSTAPVASIGPGGRQTVIWRRQHVPNGNVDTPTLSARSTAVPPVLLRAAARVAGRPRVGEPLACAAAFANAASVAYTWQRGSAVVGRASHYRPVAADRGRRLSCVAVGANAHGSVETHSADSAPVSSGAAPKATKRPKIKGQKRVGRKIKATAGRWSPSADRLIFQWFRAGKKVKGKAGKRKVYRVRRTDRGKKLQVKVVAVRAGHAKGSVRSKKVTIR